MIRPYSELAGTPLWTAVESAISELTSNNDLAETTARTYIVGYLCQSLLNKRQAAAEGLTARSETINAENVAEMKWDEGYFKFCNFEEFSTDQGLVASDFNGCSFKKVDWYWGLFCQCNFIHCTFEDCTFAGTAFPDTRFIDCKLTNCRFIQDNLGGECSFSGATAYGCTVENSPGFRPDQTADIPIP
jgi:uncharacterized protein YjbI with pentapeptide repeats